MVEDQPTEAEPSCPAGQRYDRKLKKCVPASMPENYIQEIVK